MIKRTALDKAVSDLVRERSNWTCEKCGEVDTEAQYKGTSLRMQCSHVYSRKHLSTRYDLDNCFCLCASCHSWLESRPVDHAAFARKELGDFLFEQLQVKHHKVRKWKSWERDEAKTHYQGEIKRIRAKRIDGFIGYIAAVNYE